MNSMERVLAAINHQEPDRVPLMLLFSIYGAKELGMDIETYFKNPHAVVEAQLTLQKKYNNDVLYTFFYAGVEAEAFGGSVNYIKDGPPNTGKPVIEHSSDVDNLLVPDIKDCESLNRVLEVTKKLKKHAADEIPIIGVVMSPYSLPVMQMGFEAYIKLIYFEPDRFEKLMKINQEFCLKWANAQLEAGATAICYFNPLASPTIIDKSTYEKTGYPIDKSTIDLIEGPIAFHLASGIVEPIIDLINDTDSLIIGLSSQEELTLIKDKTKEQLTLLGNMNGIEMVHWDVEKTEQQIKNIIRDAGVGGGLLISDNHGEIPWQVSETTLKAVSDGVKNWGTYPLSWIKGCNDK